jgi:hypothetical protein
MFKKCLLGPWLANKESLHTTELSQLQENYTATIQGQGRKKVKGHFQE